MVPFVKLTLIQFERFTCQNMGHILHWNFFDFDTWHFISKDDQNFDTWWTKILTCGSYKQLMPINKKGHIETFLRK